MGNLDMIVTPAKARVFPGKRAARPIKTPAFAGVMEKSA